MTRFLRRLGWLLFAAATVFLLHSLSQQQVDPSNRSLKSPDGRDAVQLRALQEVVGDDPIVLVAFAVRGDLPMLASDREELTALRAKLAALPGVAAIHDAPVPDPGLVLMPVAIHDPDAMAVAERVVAAARAGAPPALQVHATGLPLIEGTIARLVAGERQTIVPMLVAVLLAAAFAFYRHLGLAVGVLLPPIAAIAWTGGSIALLGHRLDPIASLLDPVLLTIGVAASVHFVETFRRERAAGRDPEAAATAAAAGIRTPALLATGTTMIGLWSLATSSVPAVLDFGVRSAFGVALAHFFTFLLLPAWLPRFAAGAKPAADSTWFGARWFDQLRRVRRPLVLGSVAATTLAVAGLFRVTADNDPLQLLPADEPARVDHDLLAARLGGVEAFHLLVPERSPAAEPSRLLPFLAMLRQAPGVAGLAGQPTRNTAGALAVPLVLQPGGSLVRTPLFDDVERIARVLGFDDVVAAGPSVQIARDSHGLMHSLTGSLGVSLLLLSACMVIGLRSFRLGAIGMIPNLLPALWLYGALGWWQRPVSVATAMIGCTMLGLIVDNTLHLLHHFRHARATMATRQALRHALDQTGRAMSLSSAVLMLGFGTAALSRLETTVEFALLATTTIAAAWFATAALLPLLVAASAPRLAPKDHP